MKHIVYAFLVALVAYVVFYTAIEYRRTRNGPWQVTFSRAEGGEPAIVINQPKLRISDSQILFTGTNFPSAVTNVVTLDFRQPHDVPFEVPFGKCVFLDTTFLPGTVTLELFGHEIELLPRVLIIDRKDYPWRPQSAIALPIGPATPVPASP